MEKRAGTFLNQKVASPHFPKVECPPRLGDCRVASLLAMTEKMDSRTASCVGMTYWKVGMTEGKVGKNKKTSSKPKR